MRKIVAIIVVVCLLTSGAWASFQAAAVRQIVSRGVTKICAPIPANDNRCLRLVTGSSTVLSTAATAATAIFGGPVSWLYLLAGYLITDVAGDYLLELGQKIKLWLTKDDSGKVIVSTEETQSDEVPVVETTTQSFGDAVYTNPKAVTLPTYVNSGSYTDSNGNTVKYSYESGDPNTTGKITTDFEGSGWGVSTYSQDGVFWTVDEAQKYLMAKFYGASNFQDRGYGYLQLYDGEVKAKSFYFTGNLKPYWDCEGMCSYATKKIFKGYLAEVKYVPNDGTAEQTGYVLITIHRGRFLTYCADGEFYNGSCTNFATELSNYTDEETLNSPNINKIAADKLNGTVTKTLNQPLDEYLKSLDETTLESELPAQLIADAVNKIYKDATSAEGYEGLPYDETKRLTANDVKQLAPSMPSVGDARETIVDTSSSSGVRPGTGLKTDTSTGSLTETPANPDADGVKDPIKNTSPNVDAGKVEGTGNSTGTIKDGNIDVDVNVNLDLGQYPEASEPQLEPVEASAILQPIFDLFPALQNYSVPDHESECYRPTFELWGKEYVIESHCDLLEQHRDLLKSVCSVLWAIAALFVFLKA